MKINQRNAMSTHHIIPLIRGGEDVAENKVLITRFTHRRWHDLFNEMTPDEAIEWIKKIMVAGEQWSNKRVEKLYKELLKEKAPWA